MDRLLTDHGQPFAAFSANKQLNRYEDVVCFDASRVILKDSLNSDYIHANYINGYEREKAYILTQVIYSLYCTMFMRNSGEFCRVPLMIRVVIYGE